MTFEEFLAVDPDRAEAMSPELRALALDRAGRWQEAHDLADKAGTPETQRVHGYLHRKNGELSNARYWYEQLGETMLDGPPDEEWSALVRRFLVG